MYTVAAPRSDNALAVSGTGNCNAEGGWGVQAEVQVQWRWRDLQDALRWSVAFPRPLEKEKRKTNSSPQHVRLAPPPGYTVSGSPSPSRHAILMTGGYIYPPPSPGLSSLLASPLQRNSLVESSHPIARSEGRKKDTRFFSYRKKKHKNKMRLSQEISLLAAVLATSVMAAPRNIPRGDPAGATTANIPRPKLGSVGYGKQPATNSP